MIKDIFALWRTQSDLMKLQYAYGVVILVLIVTAGLIGLLNEKVSWQILSVTWIVTVAFFVNLISYALVNLFLSPVASKPARPAAKRKR